MPFSCCRTSNLMSQDEQPSQVLITRTDGTWVTIQSPEVRADSIVGEMRDSIVPFTDAGLTFFKPFAASVAISDIRQVETQRFSPGKTGGLIVLVPVVMVVFFFVSCSLGDCT